MILQAPESWPHLPAEVVDALGAESCDKARDGAFTQCSKAGAISHPTSVIEAFSKVDALGKVHEGWLWTIVGFGQQGTFSYQTRLWKWTNR